MNRLLLIFCFLTAGCSTCSAQDCNPAASENVNSRYTVESVELTDRDRGKLSQTLMNDIRKMVGEKFNQESVDKIALRIQKELRATKVTPKVSRGDQPDHLKIQFESERTYTMSADADVTKLSYHSTQAWTAGLEVSPRIAGTEVTFGVQTDGDELVERYSGINARIARDLHPRLRIRFDFQSFHQQWNAATIVALQRNPDVPGIYRIRRNYQPSITIVLARPLTLTAGVSFEQFQTQFPAARIEAANAVINTLRYRRQWQGSDSFRQELDAAYNLRAATKALDSDYVYARNLVSARYSVKYGNNAALVKFIGGAIGGRAPLFERFVLGNTSTLRGWNKFDLDPVGGRRVAHGSVEYRYRFLQVFYDTGAIWDNPADRQQRHSAGGGFIHDDISLAVAFPLRDGHITPTFIVSVSF
jgi:hypothetical protein